MPTLTQTLDEWYGVRRCKLASVYQPPNGPAKFQESCHLIFEEAPDDGPYTWLVVDSVYRIIPGGRPIDHAAYLRSIRHAVAKGWEFAGLISLEPCRLAKGEGGGFILPPTSASVSVKLIFQAKQASTPSSAPPVLQAAVVATTTNYDVLGVQETATHTTPAAEVTLNRHEPEGVEAAEVTLSRHEPEGVALDTEAADLAAAMAASLATAEAEAAARGAAAP